MLETRPRGRHRKVSVADLAATVTKQEAKTARRRVPSSPRKRSPRVLMFGWEFPPVANGGLGTACRDLCVGLSRKGVPIIYVMPHDVSEIAQKGIQFRSAEEEMKKVRFRSVPSPLSGYMTSAAYEAKKSASGKWNL